MKKIFAIALALVMVLSMASAFASYCTAGFDWTCDSKSTYCGQGKVEVVPFVKVNNGCGGYDYEVSTCAAAVASENIYWAVKLTVDANADMEWWNEAKLVVEAKETNYKTKTWDFSKDNAKKGIDFTEDETVVYYAKVAGGWIDVEDDDLDLEAVVFAAQVKEDGKASKVKVCATLTSLGEDFVAGVVGDYYVVYSEDVLLETVKPTDGEIIDAFGGVEKKAAAEENIEKLKKAIKTNDKNLLKAGMPVRDNYVTYAEYQQAVADYEAAVAKVEAYETAVAEYEAIIAGLDVVVTGDYLTVFTDKDKDTWLVKYYIVDGKVRDIYTNKVCGEAAYSTTKDFFGIEIDTCIDQDIINANFGWDFEQEFCLPWSDKAASIVNAECVVAIPKTGDASVLAWLF